MVVNSSRILTMEQKVPTAQVGNRDVLDLTALSPTQIQVFAKKAGVTQINLWNERNEIKTIDVVVYGDARELKMVLEAQFPRASLTVTPLANSVIIGGFVDRPDMVNRIVRIAEDYHPNIINNITVGGVQQVLLDVKVMEVSRTKLRQLGMDWAKFGGGDFMVSSVSGLIQSFTAAGPTFTGQTFAIGVTNPNSQFFGVIDALQAGRRGQDRGRSEDHDRQRPAGPLPARRRVPRAGAAEPGHGLGRIPQLRHRGRLRADRAGQRPDPAGIAAARQRARPGLERHDQRHHGAGPHHPRGRYGRGNAGRSDAWPSPGWCRCASVTEKSALPWIGEMPYVGVFFRRTSSRQNEVETLILVTPHLVDAMDCHEVPPCCPARGPRIRTITSCT